MVSDTLILYLAPSPPPCKGACTGFLNENTTVFFFFFLSLPKQLPEVKIASVLYGL